MKYGILGLVVVALVFVAHAENGTPIKVATPSKVKKPKRVRILFGTVPKRVRAEVMFGKKRLGVTPFSMEFKYDSGPRDITFKKAGYFNVNTRVFTTSNREVIVKMTLKEDAHTLYGYKEKIPPDAGVPDQGVLPAVPTPSTSPTLTPLPAPGATPATPATP
jgi:hypothetical protein